VLFDMLLFVTSHMVLFLVKGQMNERLQADHPDYCFGAFGITLLGKIKWMN
jgi:hypothetical protein